VKRPAIALTLLLAAQTTWPRFEPAQPDLLSAAGSLVNAAADYDGDGDADLFVGFNGSTANRLYRNTTGVLEDVAVAAGVADARPTRAAAWGDFDGDRDPDLLVGFAPGAGPILKLYRNDRGRFVDATSAAGIAVGPATPPPPESSKPPGGAVRQPAWIDVDGDGDLDLFVAFRDRADTLFRNDNGRFTEIAAAAGLADTRKTVGAVWLDLDEDGDLDLYAAHMDGEPNALYRNDDGRFTDVLAGDAEAGAALRWGARKPADPANGTVRPCAADVDGDGRFDLFTANYGPNGLFLNRGAGKFEDVSAAWRVAIDGRYDTCAFADVDHDGRLDLYVNGTVTGGVTYRDYLFRNAETAFEDVTPENIAALSADHGALWFDLDRNGSEDLALTGAMHLVLRNRLPEADAARSLAVRVVDARGRARFAGAEIRVYDTATARLLGARLVDSGSSYNAQSAIPAHIALPSAGRVDVEVTWPARGRRTVSRVRGVDLARLPRRTLVMTVR
jgi:hypothetical protein